MNDLPKGWVIGTLSHFTKNPKQDIISGPFGSNLKSDEYVPEGIPIIRLQNIDRNRFLEKNMRFITHAKADELSSHTFKAGDVIVTKLGDPVGKACIVPETLRTGIVVADVVRIRVDKDNVSTSYAVHAINSPSVVSQINQEVKGSTRPRVNLNHLRDLEIPIAPLNEQKRIVEKLENLLGKVEAAQERLDKIPVILKRFRQSVLAAACSGKLTVDWRKDIATGEKVGDLEIPASWEWKKLPELGFLGRGKSRHRPRDAEHLYGGPYPFIQTGAIARSNGRITEHTQTYSEAGLAQSKLWEAGTVCITIAANIADSAILTYPVCFPDSVVGFVADSEKSITEFIEFFIRTARNDLSTFAPATAQKNINLSILNEVLVPTPPLDEQKEIVRRVEDLFKFADQIEERYKKAWSYTDKLTQSILAKAFRGELVPQDPNDEPASALLGRIRHAA